MHLAGDARRQVRQQVQTCAAQFLQRHAAAERRVFLLEGEHIARVGNAGAGQRADGPCRDGVDADFLVAEIDREITHRRLEPGLGDAHHIVVRHGAQAAIIGQRHHRAAVRHQRRRAFGGFREGVAGDHHGADEVFARRIRVTALEFFLVGIGDRVDQEIHRAPVGFDLVKHGVDRGDVLDVAWHQKRRSGLLGERLHALEQRVALIGEGELGAMRVQRLGDAPGDRVVVGDPHDQPAFSFHQPRHFTPSLRCRSGARAKRANPESRY